MHPHVIGSWNSNNTLYVGEGGRATRADARLRLSSGDKQISIWNVPGWLKHAGLTYHSAPERWLEGDRLQSVAKGQEFVAPVTTRDARAWVDDIIEVIDV